MQIAVSDEHTQFLVDLVRKGRFASIADAHAAAIRLLAEAMAAEGRFAPIGAHIAARLKVDASHGVAMRRRASDRVPPPERDEVAPPTSGGLAVG
jgi:Arc/MetJ-type ribon-helix-helix transcriptional regulator